MREKAALICAVAALFLIFSFCTVTYAEQAQPKVEITPAIFNLGTVDEGVKAKATFTIKNVGNADLIIYDVRPTCGCTIANLSSKILAPGKTATLDAFYNSQYASGLIRKYINVTTNDVKTGNVSLVLTANVKAKPAPDIALSVYMLSNIQVSPGGSTQRSLAISNPGQMDLVINEIAATPGMQADIDGVKVESGKTTKTSLTLKPGEIKKIEVTITPKTAKGNFQEVLTIRSNARRNPIRTFVVLGLVQ
jgi:Protein of unknown function (DUF1573)/HYDIN/CFA65/VesB-like, Ig-like domain